MLPHSWMGRRSSSWCWSCTRTASSNAGPEHRFQPSGKEQYDGKHLLGTWLITHWTNLVKGCHVPGKVHRRSLRSPWHRWDSSRTRPGCTSPMDSILGSDTICQQTLENWIYQRDRQYATTVISSDTCQCLDVPRPFFEKTVCVPLEMVFCLFPTWQGKVPQEQEREKATATLEEEKVEHFQNSQ